MTDEAADPARAALEAALADDGFVRALARRLVRSADADDLAQDAWLAALRRRPGGPGVRGWFVRVLVHLARDRVRSGSRRAVRERRAARPEVAPEQALAEREEIRRRLVAAVIALGPPASTVLALRYFEGLTATEIGARLGSSGATVRSQLKRGLAKLRERLEADRDADGRGTSAMLPVLFTARDAVRAAFGAARAAAPVSAAACGALVLAGILGVGFLAVLLPQRPANADHQHAPARPSRPTAREARVEDASAAGLKPPTASAGRPKRRLTVRVVADLDGGPLDGAMTVVHGATPTMCESTARGESAFDVPWAGRYDVEIHHREHRLWRDVVAIPDVGRALEVRLKRGAAVVGRTVDVDGAPIADVVVELVGGEVGFDDAAATAAERLTPGGARTRSGADGRFAFRGLPDGAPCKLRAPSRESWSFSPIDAYPSEAEHVLTVRTVAAADLRLVDARTGEPIARPVRVRCRVDGLPNGCRRDDDDPKAHDGAFHQAEEWNRLPVSVTCDRPIAPDATCRVEIAVEGFRPEAVQAPLRPPDAPSAPVVVPLTPLPDAALVRFILRGRTPRVGLTLPVLLWRPAPDASARPFEVHDVNELHFGAEGRSALCAVRAGEWFVEADRNWRRRRTATPGRAITGPWTVDPARDAQELIVDGGDVGDLRFAVRARVGGSPLAFRFRILGDAPADAPEWPATLEGGDGFLVDARQNPFLLSGYPKGARRVEVSAGAFRGSAVVDVDAPVPPVILLDASHE
ncbi:MAG TPA: sigma-70 family RNA polymerase sigma factor [Planctomycetota bacterium]|nr:sigma-70 family RNA polymerase sigma factor [Planctomycetota bacterium]